MISKVPCVLSSQTPFNVEHFEHRWDPGGNHRVPSPNSPGCHQFWHEFAICELIIPPPSHIKIGFSLRLWSPLIWIFSDIAYMDFYSASTELGDRHIHKSSNIIHNMNFSFLFTFRMIHHDWIVYYAGSIFCRTKSKEINFYFEYCCPGIAFTYQGTVPISIKQYSLSLQDWH